MDYLEAAVRAFERANKDVRFCLFSAQGASTSEKSPIRFARAKGRAENILFASSLSERYTNGAKILTRKGFPFLGWM